MRVAAFDFDDHSDRDRAALNIIKPCMVYEEAGQWRVWNLEFRTFSGACGISGFYKKSIMQTRTYDLQLGFACVC